MWETGLYASVYIYIYIVCVFEIFIHEHCLHRGVYIYIYMIFSDVHTYIHMYTYVQTCLSPLCVVFLKNVYVCMYTHVYIVHVCAAALPADPQKACRLTMLSPLLNNIYIASNSAFNRPQTAIS